jgi:hypothetical protein
MVAGMHRRAFLLASAVALSSLSSGLTLVRRADATTARLITLEELTSYSAYVVVATARERRSVWEDMPSGRRIVTYTRISVDRPIVGAPGGELWVRTLGGVVDKIGQSVPGEAQLALGAQALLFLAKANGVVVVAGMAQGHYPIVADDKGMLRLAPSPDSALYVARPGPSLSARERLLGATVDDAANAVTAVSRPGK